MRTAQAIKLANAEAGTQWRGGPTALGRLFDPPVSRQAIFKWGVNLPELREYQLRRIRPAWFKAKPAKRSR